MDGVLLVDKPSGWTSFDVVAKVRGILKKSGVTKPKVGHSGTLDPLATGLLVLLIGSYTKRASEFSKLDKVYGSTIKLGQTSTTGDSEGKIEPFDSPMLAQGKPSRQEIEEVLKGFVGTSLQTPHAYSAVKVGGKRAYKLARAGKEVKIEPRKITVYGLQITEYKYPFISFTTKVSSGTYIRSLAEDIGQKLGTGAYLTSLNRTQIGPFDLKDALQIEKFSFEYIKRALIDKR